MARGIREVVVLPDPIGEVPETSQLENGLLLPRSVWPWGGLLVLSMKVVQM